MVKAEVSKPPSLLQQAAAGRMRSAKKPLTPYYEVEIPPPVKNIRVDETQGSIVSDITDYDEFRMLLDGLMQCRYKCDVDTLQQLNNHLNGIDITPKETGYSEYRGQGGANDVIKVQEAQKVIPIAKSMQLMREARKKSKRKEQNLFQEMETMDWKNQGIKYQDIEAMDFDSKGVLTKRKDPLDSSPDIEQEFVQSPLGEVANEFTPKEKRKVAHAVLPKGKQDFVVPDEKFTKAINTFRNFAHAIIPVGEHKLARDLFSEHKQNFHKDVTKQRPKAAKKLTNASSHYESVQTLKINNSSSWKPKKSEAEKLLHKVSAKSKKKVSAAQAVNLLINVQGKSEQEGAHYMTSGPTSSKEEHRKNEEVSKNLNPKGNGNDSKEEQDHCDLLGSTENFAKNNEGISRIDRPEEWSKGLGDQEYATGATLENTVNELVSSSSDLKRTRSARATNLLLKVQGDTKNGIKPYKSSEVSLHSRRSESSKSKRAQKAMGLLLKVQDDTNKEAKSKKEPDISSNSLATNSILESEACPKSARKDRNLLLKEQFASMTGTEPMPSKAALSEELSLEEQEAFFTIHDEKKKAILEKHLAAKLGAIGKTPAKKETTAKRPTRQQFMSQKEVTSVINRNRDDLSPIQSTKIGSAAVSNEPCRLDSKNKTVKIQSVRKAVSPVRWRCIANSVGQKKEVKSASYNSEKPRRQRVVHVDNWNLTAN